MANNDEMLEIIAELKHDLLGTERERLMKIDEEIEILQNISKKIKRLESIDEEIEKWEEIDEETERLKKIEGEIKSLEEIDTMIEMLNKIDKETISNEEKTSPVIRKNAKQKAISKIEKLKSKINMKFEWKINIKLKLEVVRKSVSNMIKKLNSKIKKLDSKIEELESRKTHIMMRAHVRGELRKLYDAKTEENEIERILDALFEDDQVYTLSNSNEEILADEETLAVLIVYQWLLEIPQKQGEEQRVYNKAIKYLLNRVASTDQNIRESAMAHILAALGNCTTPIEALIEQTIEQMRQEGIQVFETPEQQHQFEAGRVIEKVAREVLSKSKYTGGPEDIEIVQALRNSLLLNGAKDNKSNTALKVTGNPFYLPSKTVNIAFGFRLLKKRKDLTEAFAKRFCETNEQDQLLKDESGCYKFDHNKLKNEIEKQKAEKHGILSPVYEELEQFKEQLNTCLKKEFDTLVSEHFDNTTVTAYSDVHKQAKALEKQLRKVAPDQYKTEAEQFLNQIKHELGELQKELISKAKNQPDLNRFTQPGNTAPAEQPHASKSQRESSVTRRPSQSRRS